MFSMKVRCGSFLYMRVGIFLLAQFIHVQALASDTSGAILPSTGGDFTITHHTIDAGYQEMTGGQFRLRGIVGQTEAGISEGNDTVFVSGFLSTDVPLFSSFLFRDSFEGQ